MNPPQNCYQILNAQQKIYFQMLPSPWHNLYCSRYDWAFDAYNQCVDSIKHEVLKKSLMRQNQITVVFYGETQIGKTTMLLKLLGVKQDGFDKVDDILRAGRELGNSVTPTAMYYHRSLGESWTLQETPFSDIEMKNELSKLRTLVENRQYDQMKHISIGIPNIYFDNYFASDEHLLIIDLPGINAKNKNEREYVNELIKEHIPMADIVLMTSHAHQMSSLKSENFSLPMLAYWYIQPENFRVILTHSYSLSSMRTRCQQEEDLQSIMKIYKEEMKSTLNIEHLKDIFVYPLEFGVSWTDFSKDVNNKTAFQNAEKMNLKCLETLRNDIKNAATPLGRIRRLNSVHRMFEEYKKDECKKLEGEIQKHADVRKVALDKIELVAQNKTCIENRSNNLKNAIDEASKEFEGLEIPEIDYNTSDRSWNTMQCEAQTKMEGLISNICNVIKNHIGTKDFITKISYSNTCFETQTINKTSSTIDCYWFDSTYKTDHKMVNDAMHRDTTYIKTKIKTEMKSLLKNRLTSDDDEIKKLNACVKLFEKEKTKSNDEINKLEIERSEFTKKVDEAIQDSKNSPNMFQDCFKHAIQENYNQYEQEVDLVQKFFHLAYQEVLYKTQIEIGGMK